MTDLFAFPSADLPDDQKFAASLDVDSLRLDTVAADEWILAASYRAEAPLAGQRTFSDARWAVVFAGDLVEHGNVPFRQIVEALDSGCPDFFAALNGIFAIAAYDKQRRRLYAISDRRSQKPLFYRVTPRGLHISTSLSTFLRLADNLEVDKAWIWQVLYFNIPVDEATFLKDVKRFAPATVLTYVVQSQDLSGETYAEPFRRPDVLRTGDEALGYATDLFAERVPEYFRGSREIACALTGGWDGRTMLALAPDRRALTAYTYGIPGCSDSVNAKRAATAAGIDHLSIPFDDAFVDDLPHHALETVYLSGGLQGVLRSTLHHAYRELTQDGRRFPLSISGISLDSQFRGHANCPNLISADLANHFRGRGSGRGLEHWREVLGNDHAEFAELIHGQLGRMESEFGPLDSPEHHLSYYIYKVAANHFCGELAVSEPFTTVRVPCWDTEVIRLSYSITQSMLTFSQFLEGHNRGSRDEVIFQCRLLRKVAPDLYRLVVRTCKPAAALAGEVPYKLARTYFGGIHWVRTRALSRREVPLEDWDTWYFSQHRDFVDGLLCSPETLVTNYVEAAAIDRVIANRNMYYTGKLLTIEIILRLVKSGWRRFW